ncbi:ATP-binding protein [Rhodococcus erythropolis]
MSESQHSATQPPPVLSSDAVERIILQPDPRLVASLGANHSIPTALADLVDNAIDAQAARVAINFVAHRHRLVQIEIIDDGIGMDHQTINGAMTLGHQRTYHDHELGHFGLGLKAAAMGNARTLTVFSTRANTQPVGRRLKSQDMARDYSCEVISDAASTKADSSRTKILSSNQGTLIEISDLTSAYNGKSDEEAQIFLEDTIQDVRHHLGIIFHRIIESGTIEITTDQTARKCSKSLPTKVRPINPFGYSQSGNPNWPLTLSAQIDGEALNLRCHIWPAKTKSAQFRLNTQNGVDAQGIYVYRGDRLIQAGGWSNVMSTKRNYQLARVELEFEEAKDHLKMNPEKSSLKFSPELNRAIGRASRNSTNFQTFLSSAESVMSEASKRNHVRKPSIPISKGISQPLKRAIKNEVGFSDIYEPISIRWKRLHTDRFVEIDFRDRTINLNNRYRSWFTGERSGINDSPILKSLLYLLTRETFQLENHSARAKDDISMWEEVLSSALMDEIQTREPSGNQD